MPELAVAVSAGVLIVATWALNRYGTALSVFLLNIVLLAIFPVLLTPESTQFHVGIAEVSPAIRSFSLALVIQAVALLLLKGRSPVTPMWLPLVAWLAIAKVLFWPSSEVVNAGLLHLVIGLAAFSVGSYLGSILERTRYENPLATLLLAIIALEAVVCVIQFSGFELNPMDANDSAILGNRTNGLANHPGNLGKIIVFLMILALPLTRSSSRGVRAKANIALFGSFAPLALAQGRANIVAAIMVVVVWALLLPRARSMGLKAAMLAGALVAGLGVVGVILARFEEDPTGGVRGEISGYAIQKLSDVWATGVGPNFYTSALGPETGSWIPVHNSFLLAAVELGLIGALLLFCPIALLLLRAWKFRNRPNFGDGSKALIASVPALLLIGLTGWGLLGSSIFALWFYVFGFFAAESCSSNTHRLVSFPSSLSTRRIATSHPDLTTPNPSMRSYLSRF